jgi:hypothetical protein
VLRHRIRTVRAAALLLGLGSLSLPATAAHATDSLATPMTGRLAQELWPIEVSIAVVPANERTRGQNDGQQPPLPRRTVVVPDGHRLRFTSVVPGSHGKRRFEVAVVPRHHPDAVELEWDLEVHEARFRPVGWAGYVRHRLNLGQKLEVGEERLKIARSDIVSTRGEPVRVPFEIDGELFEIQMLAVTTRG